MNRIVMLFLFATSMGGCLVNKPGNQLLGSVEKLGCYGKCPKYKVEIYDNGQVVFNGEQNVSTIGRVEIVFDSEELKIMKRAFAKLSWDTINSEYLTASPDLPKIRIMNGSGRGVLFHSRKAPKELRDLSSKVETILSKHVN